MSSNAHSFNVEKVLNAAREYLKEVGPLGVLPLLWPYYVAEDAVIITYLTPRTEAAVRLLAEMGESIEALEEPARAYIWRPHRELLQAAREFDECMNKVYEEGALLAASEGYKPEVPTSNSHFSMGDEGPLTQKVRPDPSATSGGISGRPDCPPNDGCSPEPMGGTGEPPWGNLGRGGGQCLKYDLLIMEAAGLVAAENESLSRRIFT